MDFESHTLGVKIEEGNISVELIESLKELSKYQFILSDKISHSYNGNTTYGIDIKQLTTQKCIEFFGWKLISLSFPGNWYGEVGLCVLEDLYGKQKRISSTIRAKYHIHYKSMIEESIETVRKFAEKNYSVDYSEIIEKESLLDIRKREDFFGVPIIVSYVADVLLLPVGNKISLKGFTKLISSTKQYIEDCQKVLSTISDKKDDRSILFVKSLKEHSTNVMKEYYSFEIEELSNSIEILEKVKKQ